MRIPTIVQIKAYKALVGEMDLYNHTEGVYKGMFAMYSATLPEKIKLLRELALEYDSATTDERVAFIHKCLHCT